MICAIGVSKVKKYLNNHDASVDLFPPIAAFCVMSFVIIEIPSPQYELGFFEW